MSQENIQQYVVTLRYQERGLADLLELNSTLLAAGFTTTLNDAQGHPHELGSNNFGLITALPPEEVQQLARGLGERVLESAPDVDVQLWQDFYRQDRG